jgi:hypothetical protein
MPTTNLQQTFAVASPTPAGNNKNHRFIRRANTFSCKAAYAPDSIIDAAISTVCSVSSETIPRPNRNRKRVGGPGIFAARRSDIPSYGNPNASPTAVPIRHPQMARSLIFYPRFANESEDHLTPLPHRDSQATNFSRMPVQVPSAVFHTPARETRDRLVQEFLSQCH